MILSESTSHLHVTDVAEHLPTTSERGERANQSQGKSGRWKWKVEVDCGSGWSGPVEVEGLAVAEIRFFWILQVFIICAWCTFGDRSLSSEGIRHSSLGFFLI